MENKTSGGPGPRLADFLLVVGTTLLVGMFLGFALGMLWNKSCPNDCDQCKMVEYNNTHKAKFR